MFNNSKYTTWYHSIVKKAQDRDISGYTEKHHILPKSLGGDNSGSNLVRLTAREHYVCHLLLIRMTESAARRKMINAAYAMGMLHNPDKHRRYASRSFEVVRLQQAENMRTRAISDETRARMSASAKKRANDPARIERQREIGRQGKGRSKSDEWKAKQSAAQIGKPKKNHEEWLANVRAAAKRRSENMTEETREKLRTAGEKGRASRYKKPLTD